jgi:hypothetical protein
VDQAPSLGKYGGERGGTDREDRRSTVYFDIAGESHEALQIRGPLTDADESVCEAVSSSKCVIMSDQAASCRHEIVCRGHLAIHKMRVGLAFEEYPSWNKVHLPYISTRLVVRRRQDTEESRDAIEPECRGTFDYVATRPACVEFEQCIHLKFDRFPVAFALADVEVVVEVYAVCKLAKVLKSLSRTTARTPGVQTSTI